jgi:hypothetical protein
MTKNRVQVLEERLASLQATLRDERAKEQQRQRVIRETEKRRERKRDGRRKILIGAMNLWEISQGELDPEHLKARLKRYLTRDDDRALFGFEPLPDGAMASPASNGATGHANGDASGVTGHTQYGWPYASQALGRQPASPDRGTP